MNKLSFIRRTLLIVAATLCGPSMGTARAADAPDHRLAVHVDQNDPAVMNLALSNVANVQKYYADKGETVVVEVVAYGPGLHMLRADTSPVKDRIVVMSLESDSLTFSACGNTQHAMEKQEGKPVELLEEAAVVPSGVVQLIELQEAGYAYVRP